MPPPASCSRRCDISPTVPPERAQLADRLKELYEAAKARDPENFTTDALAGRLHAQLREGRAGARPYDQSRVSRVVNNRARVSVEEAVAFARECGATRDQLAEIRALAAPAQDTATIWRPTEAGSIVEAQKAVGAREIGARDIRALSTAAVNGLANTLDYATALFTLVGAPDVTDAVRARRARQAALTLADHQFTMLHTEGAIRWRPGSRELLADQLAALIALSRRDNVRVGVLPFDMPAPATYESRFAIYDDWKDGRPAMLEAEYATGESTTTRPSVVATYRDRFAKLESAALWDDQAREFIERVRGEGAG